MDSTQLVYVFDSVCHFCFFCCTFTVAFCVGLFQLGSGKLLAVWTAIFVNKNETKELWGECAEVLKLAGIDGLYSGVVHFRDRHTGCAVFEEALKIGLGMLVTLAGYCVCSTTVPRQYPIFVFRAK